jgi:hypothetical protein
LLVFSAAARAGGLAQDGRIELYRRVDRACRAGNISALRAFAIAGVDLDPPDVKNYTHLETAADAGQLDVVRFLLDRGADPNGHGAYGPSPLCAALRGRHFDVARLLVAAGASCVRRCRGDDSKPLPRPKECPDHVAAEALRLVDLETDGESGDTWHTADRGVQLSISAKDRFELVARADNRNVWIGRIGGAMPVLRLTAERKLTFPAHIPPRREQAALPVETPSAEIFQVRAVDDATLRMEFAGRELILQRH